MIVASSTRIFCLQPNGRYTYFVSSYTYFCLCPQFVFCAARNNLSGIFSSRRPWQIVVIWRGKKTTANRSSAYKCLWRCQKSIKSPTPLRLVPPARDPPSPHHEQALPRHPPRPGRLRHRPEDQHLRGAARRRPVVSRPARDQC